MSPYLLISSQYFIFLRQLGEILLRGGKIKGFLQWNQKKIIKNSCGDKNIVRGACFREEVCGTNAIALAMRLQKTVVLSGKNHFCKLFQNWSCIAKPIRFPCGDIAGYLDVSMSNKEGFGNTIALVQVVVKCIEEQMSSKILFDNNITSLKINTLPESLAIKLSLREKEVLRLMGEELSWTKIAATLGISRETVKTHQVNIYKKLEVNIKHKCLEKAKQLGLLIE